MPGRDREVGQAGRLEVEAQVGHLGDPPRVGQCVRHLGEELAHLGRRLEVELLAVETEPSGRVEVRGGADAQEHVVGVGLGLVDVVQVIGGHERQGGVPGQAQELLVQAALFGEAVILELEEEVALPEDVAIGRRGAPCLGPVVGAEGARHFAVEARREPDQAFRVAGQALEVDARLVVVALEVSVGGQPAEVAVAGPVLGQQDEMEGLRVRPALALGHGAAGDVGLHADDRLDLARPAGLVESDRPVERAVVGQGERLEAEGGGLAGEVVDAPETVEEAELRMDMEMDEVIRSEGHGG